MNPTCQNCQHLHSQPWNMVIAEHHSCRKGKPFRQMFRPTCDLFEPTLKAVDTDFLRELHLHEVGPAAHRDGRHHGHVWRIVNDPGRHKRVSGNPGFWLWFNNESQLDTFYEKYKHLIHL